MPGLQPLPMKSSGWQLDDWVCTAALKVLEDEPFSE
jgi:hypothetical protein